MAVFWTGSLGARGDCLFFRVLRRPHWSQLYFRTRSRRAPRRPAVLRDASLLPEQLASSSPPSCALLALLRARRHDKPLREVSRARPGFGRRACLTVAHYRVAATGEEGYWSSSTRACVIATCRAPLVVNVLPRPFGANTSTNPIRFVLVLAQKGRGKTLPHPTFAMSLYLLERSSDEACIGGGRMLQEQ